MDGHPLRTASMPFFADKYTWYLSSNIGNGSLCMEESCGIGNERELGCGSREQILTQGNSNQANLLRVMIMVIMMGIMRIMGANVDTMENSTRPNFRTGYPSHSSLSRKRFKTYFSAMGVNFDCLFSEAELSNSFFANIWTPLPISSTTNLLGWLQKKAWPYLLK